MDKLSQEKPAAKQSKLSLIANSELQTVPDYASRALTLLKTETESILCEVDRIFDKHGQQIELEVQHIWDTEKKPNRLQCLPMLPCYAKVSLRNMVAPLVLKFEFFDLHSN